MFSPIGLSAGVGATLWGLISWHPTIWPQVFCCNGHERKVHNPASGPHPNKYQCACIYIYVIINICIYIYIIHILYCCFMLVLYRNFLPICSHISSYHPLIIVYSSYRIFLFYPWPGSAPRAPGSEGVPRPGLPGDRRWMRWVLGAWAVPFSGSWGDFYGYYNWYNHGIFSPINWDKPW